MNLQLQSGYFSLKSPLQIIDRWINPYRYKESINLRGKNLDIIYSGRAKKLLEQRVNPLIVELQLYFTCVVQKRVLFHEDTELETTVVNPKLKIAYHTVQSNACDPVEFADKHPVKKELNSDAAHNMRPSQLKIDYINKQWIGEFSI